MKTITLFLYLILLVAPSYGQANKSPRNLKQAIRWLDRACSDSLKDAIRNTPDEHLERLFYPWGGELKTVFNWTTGDENSLMRYFKGKDIELHNSDVILIAYKRHISGLPIKEVEIYNSYAEIERKWKAEDKIRYDADTLRGVYIPKDIYDCFVYIDSMFEDSTRQTISKWNENEMGRLHRGFGMWMRNNWQLWGGSRLSKYFNELGIDHAEDMSGIILSSYHRWINNKEIQLSEQILFYQTYWTENQKLNEQKRREDFAKNNVGDTVEFDSRFGYSSRKQEARYDSDECYPYGVITGKDSVMYKYKILLLESCGRRGIIYYDNKNSKQYNPQTKEWSKPKRIVKYMKKGDELWLKFEYWNPYYGL